MRTGDDESTPRPSWYSITNLEFLKHVGRQISLQWTRKWYHRRVTRQQQFWHLLSGDVIIASSNLGPLRNRPLLRRQSDSITSSGKKAWLPGSEQFPDGRLACRKERSSWKFWCHACVMNSLVAFHVIIDVTWCIELQLRPAFNGEQAGVWALN